MSYRPSIVFVDPIGTVYDGETVGKRALGGSESATVLMARELAKIGFDVTIFNNCRDVDCSPGIYDGVRYRHLHDLMQCDSHYDIMVSLRTIIPFVPAHLRDSINNNTRTEYAKFARVQQASKYKVLWMHDTFTWGDPALEDLVVKGFIDEIFTLSDFHTSYISNCWHGGNRRNFEVLKNKIYQTRNGITKYFDSTDITQKDRNLFVYVASVSKGLPTLLNKVWPLVKSDLPDAKLMVVGGYYHFSSNSPGDEQQRQLEELAQKEEYKKQDVTFTGIISQKQVAEVFQKASYFLYPGTFPETFSISALESLYYNTPLITVRFGALEETALDYASYFIDYAAAPNSLFPQINENEQSKLIARKAFEAYHNTYLHQQKMYACNIVKEVAGWDTVALQWKQHFYRRLGLYLPVEEYRKVSYINDRVHKIFNRRFSNLEEWGTYKLSKEQPISIITPFYNAKDYILRCIDSVATQNYDNWKMYIVDDNSDDGSLDLILAYIKGKYRDITDKFHISHNVKNKGAVHNQIRALRENVSDDNIVMLVDGDDALINNPNIFNFYNNLFADDKTDYAYGSCWSMVDNIPLVAQPYPDYIKNDRAYRQHKFNWGMPYPHLRVFRKSLINNIDDSVFKDENGEWFKAGGDNATFYNIIEQARPTKVVAVPDIFYLYNDINPLNDYKVNGELQNKNAAKITGNKTKVTEVPVPVVKAKETVVKNNMKKKILIAIPTARNIEVQTFKAVYDLIVPEGYETTFQYFYGYNVDQVRNLIAEWVVKGEWDYLFAVDADISFPKDTLVKLLAHDKDVVSGLYIQRFSDRHVLEIFEANDRGGFTHIPYDKIKGKGLVEIGACGFGCALIKKNVLVDIGYPQFVYKSAINHNDTFSEDLYFAMKAREKGFKLYADTSILCDHHGMTVFKV